MIDIECLKNEYEKNNLIYTIEEMKAMSKKELMAEICVLTYDQSWVKNKVIFNTVKALTFYAELKKGFLENSFGLEITFVEEYEIVSRYIEGWTISQLAKVFKRSPKTTSNILFDKYKSTRHSRAIPTKAILENGEVVLFRSQKKAFNSELCTATWKTFNDALRKEAMFQDHKTNVIFLNDSK